MKKLNNKQLFDIFSQGDEQVYADNGVQEIFDTPFTLLGTVVRGVENYLTIDMIYTYKLAHEYTSVSEPIKLKYFNTLVNYLDRIDITQSDTLIQAIDELGYDQVHQALTTLLTFYESNELYEQCIIIFRFFNNFLNK